MNKKIFIATSIALTLSALSGCQSSNSIDVRDVGPMNQAFLTASRAPVGQTIYWTNVRTGNWGNYRPVRDGHRRFDGLYCREFVSNGMINGRAVRVYNTACRHPNGTWESF